MTLLEEERQNRLMEVYVGNVWSNDYNYNESSAEEDQHHEVAYGSSDYKPNIAFQNNHTFQSWN